MLTYEQTRTLVSMAKEKAGLVELQELLESAGLVLLRQREYQRAITAAEVCGGGGLQSREGYSDVEVLGDKLVQHREASLPSEGARGLITMPELSARE